MARQKKSTKEYSILQETKISEYLGWKTVSASGARPCNPGDIKGDMWLGECKTHIHQTDHIGISKLVWIKIRTEAKSLMKRPALFTDCGTQRLEDTWAIVPARFFPNVSCVQLPIKEALAKISFKLNDDTVKNIGDSACKISIDNESLLIMKLSTFKLLLDEV